jgi:exodeoxyribonuclease VII large subunit
MEKTLFSVSEFVTLTNQTLEYAYPVVAIEGEVAEYKVSQGKWVFFKLKDAESTLECFIGLYQLRVPIENGMKVIVQASPKLTKWGRFSLTVRTVKPSGEGALKKSAELLRAKLEKEGLFAPERKRPLPSRPEKIAVISSVEAAGYADFIKILNDRWGGVQVQVAHVQVQGDTAPDQMIRALRYLNEQEELPEVIVLIRGGGSADDLAAFNDEQLVRAIAASRVPTLVGVGHEVDETLADLVADLRAATPSNAAQLLVPDKRDMRRAIRLQMGSLAGVLERAVDEARMDLKDSLADILDQLEDHAEVMGESLGTRRALLAQLNPQTVLARGYAIVRGTRSLGETIEVETINTILEAEVTNVRHK